MESNRLRSLNQWLILGLASGYVTLVFDLRYEHNHALKHHSLAWTPIIYSAVMAVACVIALVKWDQAGRSLLLWLSGVGFIVAILGVWLHNDGHILTGLHTLLSVWAGQRPDPTKDPPILAPLSFAGLSLLGMAACSNRFKAGTA